MLKVIEDDTNAFIDLVNEQGNKFKNPTTVYGFLYTNKKDIVESFEQETKTEYKIDDKLNVTIYRVNPNDEAYLYMRGLTVFRVWLTKDVEMSETLKSTIDACTATVKSLYELESTTVVI